MELSTGELATGLSTSRMDALIRVGRALADPTRCRMLVAMLDGPVYPARLAETLGLTRSNVSNHLTCLRGCGLVAATPQGRQVRYELADPALAHALTDLLQVVLDADPDHVHTEPNQEAAEPAVAEAELDDGVASVSASPERPGLAHAAAASARPHEGRAPVGRAPVGRATQRGRSSGDPTPSPSDASVEEHQTRAAWE